MIGFAVPVEGLSITKGAIKGFTRNDIENGVTREFCPDCGTHMFTRAPGFPQGVIIKTGSLDDPAVFGGPDFAAYAADAQPWHHLADERPIYQKWPA